MKYIIDTQVFLWSLSEQRKLKPHIRTILTDSQHHIFVSLASAWEIAIKHKIGKLPLKTTLARCFEVSSFIQLPISLHHIVYTEKLPLYHKDPFDRMLIAQAKSEGLTIISKDPKIWKYDVDVLRA